MIQQMTSRERVLTALAHKPTDRTPFVPGSISRPVKQDLCRYLGLRSLADLDQYLLRLGDIRRIHPDYVGPSHRNCTDASGLIVDIWGVGRKSVSYGPGEYEEITRYPLANINSLIELDDYEWPRLEWLDAGNIKEHICAANQGNQYAFRLGNGNIFETSWYMRGFESLFVDLLINPELAWEIMSRVTDFYIGYFRKMLESADGLIDIAFTADDIGQQQGLLLSLDLWEKMIKPHHVRLNKVLHEYGVNIMYHSDGAVMEAVPGLIDMGIDILEALQFDARGMDPVKLKQTYGDRLCFHGGISVQSTLPFGTTEDVRREVQDRICVLGNDGGYILAPSHVIQAGTPVENVMAFWEESGVDLSLLSGCS